MSSKSALSPSVFERVTPAQRKTLLAAALGWGLDAFDVMLYAMVITYIIHDLGMTKDVAGLLNTLTLLASGLGGVLFGFIADRIGRKKSLMLSILTYSVLSFACGLSTSIRMLALFRFILGLGMGGEWNSGATLVAETWPTELRAKALSVVQSSWALGYAAAALVSGIVLRYFNWRWVFFVGIAPALVTLWFQNGVPESEIWKQHQHRRDNPKAAQGRFSELFAGKYGKRTLLLGLVNFFGLFAWWGLFSWIPPYLSLPVSQGGRGFGVFSTTALLMFLNLAGMFPGYLSFGWFADRLGRRKAFFLYLFAAAILVPIYAQARNAFAVLLLGAVVAFFGTGFFSGSGIIGSELFPTELRARALGVTYNGARMLSAAAPWVIGAIGKKHGLNGAFYLCAVTFFLSAMISLRLPETRGQRLE